MHGGHSIVCEHLYEMVTAHALLYCVKHICAGALNQVKTMQLLVQLLSTADMSGSCTCTA